jgi:hypothetical protein
MNKMKNEWCVVTYESRPLPGRGGEQMHKITPASVFGPFVSRIEAIEWAERHPRIRSWSVKAMCEPQVEAT